jgi:arsenite-transporting ATPase
MRVADRLLGGSTLSELSQFLVSIEGMYDGFKQRAEGVLELLAMDTTTFLVVTTLEEVPFQEARFFVEKLREAGMHLGGAIVNKLLPDSLLDPEAAALARRLAAGPDPVLRALGENFLDHRVLAQRDRDLLERVDELGVPLIGAVRRQARPVGDLRGLLEVAEELSAGISA